MILLLSFILFHAISARPDTEAEMQALRKAIFNQQLELINRKWGY